MALVHRVRVPPSENIRRTTQRDYYDTHPTEQTIPLHDVVVRLRQTPYALYGWQALEGSVRESGAGERGRGGVDNRVEPKK